MHNGIDKHNCGEVNLERANIVKDELIEKLEPPFIGWASVPPETFDTPDVQNIWNLNLSKTASRFEIGTPCTISLVGAREAMKMLLHYGLENVRRKIVKLTDHLIEAVEDQGMKLQTPKEKQCRSGIVNFKINKPEQFAQKLERKGIIVSVSAQGIRVSPHYYNTTDEIDRLMEETKAWSKAHARD